MLNNRINRRDLLKYSFTAGLGGMTGENFVTDIQAGISEEKTKGLPRLRIMDVQVFHTNILGMNYIPVKIITNEPGLYGVGDASLYGRDHAVIKCLDEYFKPMIIGRDPDRIEDIWQNIFRSGYWRGGPVQMSALSGIDMALWDIKGKRAGMPVYSLLGGKCREGLLIYTPMGGRDLNELEDNIRKKMEDGVKVFRVHPPQKGSQSPYLNEIRNLYTDLSPEQKSEIPDTVIWDEDEYLKAVPKTFEYLNAKFDKEIKFCLDVHERISLNNAMQIAKILEPYNMFFVEDLLRPEHKESFRLIRNHTTAPLAMGELFNTKWDFLPLIIEQLIDYIRMDLAHSGGITEARKVASIAEPFYIKTAWHGPAGYDLTPITMAANIHVDFAISNFGIQEYIFYNTSIDELFPNSIKYKNGYLEIGDEPGLGCDINETLIKKHPPKKVILNTIRKPDGSIQDY